MFFSFLFQDGVEFKREEAKEAFVMTFEESATNKVVTAKETKLCSELDRLGLCYSKDEFFIASMFKKAFLKKNPLPPPPPKEIIQ